MARTPRLLVACDYDGTLAPIVADPWSAYPLPETVAALRSLAILPETTAAVISGRALRELAALSRLPAEVHLVGSHGTEFDVGFVHALDEPARALRRKLLVALRDLAGDAPGVLLEVKPASVAVHVRQAAAEVARSRCWSEVAARAGHLGRRAGHRGQRRAGAVGGRGPTRATPWTWCASSAAPRRWSSWATA